MEDADLSLVETSDGLQIIWKGRELYDTRPSFTAAAKARSLPVQDQTLYLLASPGAWHGVGELLARLPERSSILAVEPEPVLLELAKRLKPPKLPGDRVVLCGANLSEVRTAVPNPGAYRRVRELSFSRAALTHRDRYRAIRDALDQAIRIHWGNRLTLSDMGRLWNANLIRNLSHLAGAARFPQTTRAVFVCGAGPSLARALPVMRAHRDRVRIIAVDTALPSLVASGLDPDYVVAVDGQIANLYDFLPVADRRYRLIADLASTPAVADLHPEETICWITSRYAEIGLLDRVRDQNLPVREVPPLGSVGVTAASIALEMTPGPVLLTGLDFAHAAPGGEKVMADSHAPGSPAGFRQLLASGRLNHGSSGTGGKKNIVRSGLSGGPVATTLPMIGYAEQLSALVASDRNAAVSRHPRREVVSIEPFGLPTGARAVGSTEAGKIVNGTGSPAVRPESGGMPAAGERSRRTTILTGFVRNELTLLDSLGGLLSAAPARPDALARAFSECNYVAVAFPDYDGTVKMDKGFLTRLRVSVEYYRDRWENALRRLRS